MASTRWIFRLIPALLLLVLTGCLEQYDPRPYWNQFRGEREKSNAPAMKLNADGTLPTAGAATAAEVTKYDSLCASCHGPNGDAATGAGMNPKPRDFTDAAWQASVDDARIAKVIKEGGTAVGLSATMPPWGSMVNESETVALVAKIRSFKK